MERNSQAYRTFAFLIIFDRAPRIGIAVLPPKGEVVVNAVTFVESRFDALNRATQRSYATLSGTPVNYQATPKVTYVYGDEAPAVRKLLKVITGNDEENPDATTEYTAFDILGRVKAHKQTLEDGKYEYTTGYAYNLPGALIEQTYPSGRKVQNVLDADGSLEMVKSRKNASSGYWAYANNFTYNAAGAVTSMQLGNGTWESTLFNSRLQPTQIALGTTQNATDLLKLEYGYGTTDNNGNVHSQKITVPGVTHPFMQTYSYDALNRLESAVETQNLAETWRQTFTFDRYGNRRFKTSGSKHHNLRKLLYRDLQAEASTSRNRYSTGAGCSYEDDGVTIDKELCFV